MLEQHEEPVLHIVICDICEERLEYKNYIPNSIDKNISVIHLIV
jgi:hypothetical protein